MFDSIRGCLLVKDLTRVVVEAGGLGYEMQVPLSTFDDLPRVGDELRLLLHPVIRESDWRLFGFLTESERKAFRAMLKVNGVGPMMALGVLSGLEPAAFRAAVVGGDVKALTKVKGIGKKTAERIVVELKDVVAGDGEEIAAPAADSPAAQDAVRALVALGLDAAEARRRVEPHAEDAALQVGELVRRALRG